MCSLASRSSGADRRRAESRSLPSHAGASDGACPPALARHRRRATEQLSCTSSGKRTQVSLPDRNLLGGPARRTRSGGSLRIARRARRGGFRRRARLPGVAGDRQPAIEIEGGADERQVRERLRKVAEVLGLKAELLAVQPQVIGVAEHLLEEEA